MNMDELVDRMKTCRLCEDLPLGPKPLFRLNAAARILIAGQAPGRKTHARGLPFDDVSGNRLRDWMGIDRAVFYGDPRVAILPMGLCYPGTGAHGDLPPRVECARVWREDALSHLQDLSLIVILGRYAIDWHLPELKRASVTQAVTRWPDLLPLRIILPHPSPRNARWIARNPWFERETLPALRARIAQILEVG